MSDPEVQKIAARLRETGTHNLDLLAEEVCEILSEDRDRRETWNGLLEWMDRRWPEDLFPTVADRPDRDTGPRLTSALRKLAAIRAEVATVPPGEAPVYVDHIMRIIDGETHPSLRSSSTS